MTQERVPDDSSLTTDGYQSHSEQGRILLLACGQTRLAAPCLPRTGERGGEELARLLLHDPGGRWWLELEPALQCAGMNAEEAGEVRRRWQELLRPAEAMARAVNRSPEETPAARR